MTDKQKKDRRGHWMKPHKGGWRPSHHLLLWPFETLSGKRVKAPVVGGIHVYLNKDGTADKTSYSTEEGHALEHMLDRAGAGKGTLTIWIPGGWDHLVLSGLAGLIDDGVITWRYCSIESHRVLIRGQWRGKNIIVTSLANWTGSTWEAWRDKVDDRGIALYASCWGAIAKWCHVASIGSVPPSAGAAGMLLWRSSLGPQIEVMEHSPAAKKKQGSDKGAIYIGPLPSRPKRCRHAERHCAYGLTHRQLRRGLVDEKIYCVDFREAYLFGLMTMVQPVCYTRTLHRPDIHELADGFSEHTGCALVQVRSPEVPYPVRRNGRTLWATGEFWTWLAGMEIASALHLSHIVACQTAYLWVGKSYRSEEIALTLSLGSTMKESWGPLPSAAWRSVYSHLVGRFAAWRKRWVDCTVPNRFGRWSMFHGIDAETGAPVTYRSIAGRVQRLEAKEDAGDSVALFFACVTAQVRYAVHQLALLAEEENVIAIEADAIWVNQTGWQKLQRRCSERGIAPDRLATKEVFDRAWLTGEAIAVVEMAGKQYLRCPGVPADIAVGTRGDVSWPQGDDWHADGGPDEKRGVRRHERRYSAKEIMRLNSSPAVRLSLSDSLSDPIMGIPLLQPLSQIEGSVFGD